jgi:hypothetical protein
MGTTVMIRSSKYMNLDYRVLKRTYTREEWNANRMNYIEEARLEAEQIRPGRIELYVKESKRQKGVKMVVIKAH